jgi:hypothetical protein
MPHWKPFQEVPEPKNTAVSGGRWFRNGKYQVTIYPHRDRDGRACLEIALRREDRKAIFDWRDVQLIKNQLCGAEEEWVQLFPAESRLVDTANQYYFFSYPGRQFPFGTVDRTVSQDIQVRAGEDSGWSRQRPFRAEHRPHDLDAQQERMAKMLQECGARRLKETGR